MTVAALGFVGWHASDYNASTTGDALVACLAVPAWLAQLKHYSSIATPGSSTPRRPGVIRSSEREAIYRAMIADAANREVSMASESLLRSTDDRAELSTSRPGVGEQFSSVRGLRPAHRSASDDAWVAAVVDLLRALGATTGVVVAMDNLAVLSETTGAGMIAGGKLSHPFPDEFQRQRGRAAKEIGTRYMRFPRWGTLVSHDHVAALGGALAITSAVEPAVVRPLSGGTYFQLTASVATALSDEAMAKQRAFTELAAPLLPPPVTPPG